MEMSLLINKNIIDTLTRGASSGSSAAAGGPRMTEVHKIVLKLREDNNNMERQVRQAYEEKQLTNSRILMLEQINDDCKDKERG